MTSAAPELLERVVDSVVVLGAASMKSSGRSKEQERLSAAASIARRIGLLPGSRDFRLRMPRMYALPTAAYGWVARSPTKAACDKLDAVVHTGERGFKKSPKALRLLLEGASLALEAVVGVRQVSLWRRRLLTEAQQVQPGESSRLQQQAMHWLAKAGWLQQGQKSLAPRHWRCSAGRRPVVFYPEGQTCTCSERKLEMLSDPRVSREWPPRSSCCGRYAAAGVKGTHN